MISINRNRYLVLYYLTVISLLYILLTPSCNIPTDPELIAVMPSPITQILPENSDIYVLLSTPSSGNSLFFITVCGSIQPLKLINPSTAYTSPSMFAILDEQRFILLRPDINRIECRNYSGKINWYYESLYTRWTIGSRRQGHAFIAANNETVVLYTRILDVVRLIWINALNGKVIKIVSPSTFKNNEINEFGLGECKGMQLDDNGTLMIAFNSTLFCIDKTIKVDSIKFSQPIIGLYKNDKILVATTAKKRIIDLFVIQKNKKPHVITRIILKQKDAKLMGINKNYCYFIFNTNDIWRINRRKTIFISGK
ncbi:MAG: hypothetical protein K6T88_07690 [Bacillus sp. (in: Bacteria)]|nr:hypothetical protein [Bacillus sp. (in: firmicutes)]